MNIVSPFLSTSTYRSRFNHVVVPSLLTVFFSAISAGKSQRPVTLLNVAVTFSPSLVFNATSALVNVAVTFSLLAVTLILSVAALAVAVGSTFRLKVSPTVPISSLTFTAVFVVSETTHFPSLATIFVFVPSGNVIVASEAPLEIVIGTSLSYACTFFTDTAGAILKVACAYASLAFVSL